MDTLLKDRRNYPRMRLDTMAAIFDDNTHKEITVKVHDIGENGICFEIPVQYRDLIEVGDELEFQFVENYDYGHKEESDVVMDKCRVRHIEEAKNRHYFLAGCIVNSGEYNQFAVKRQTAAAVSTLCIRHGRANAV